MVIGGKMFPIFILRGIGIFNICIYTHNHSFLSILIYNISHWHTHIDITIRFITAYLLKVNLLHHSLIFFPSSSSLRYISVCNQIKHKLMWIRDRRLSCFCPPYSYLSSTHTYPHINIYSHVYSFSHTH